MSNDLCSIAKQSKGLKMTKSAQLKEILISNETEFLMEAHDGVSAKIVEEAGFKGIWASGLAMSTALGVRDSNEASWTQILEILEFMADASQIPILVDGDTGYGNFNNLRRAVRKLCQRGIAGICIEDKLFPKTNSFIGEGQPLADIDEFCGKIKAGKDIQLDDDFSIIARIEALISGMGMKEALKRASAYFKAGADGILIHSKQRDGDEVINFLEEWANRCPVIIVPTTYYQTPTKRFKDAKASVIIWANHNIRAATSAMREVSLRIQRDQSLIGIEDRIASVSELFKLANNRELAEAEKLYLPPNKEDTKAIILAASRGEDLQDLTVDRPKCMIDVRGQPLLHRLTSTFNQAGIREIYAVRGYKKSAVNLPSVNFKDNNEFDTTGEVFSLSRAKTQIKGNCIFSYGDILFRHYILDQLLKTTGDIVLVVDARWMDRDPNPQSRTRDLIKCAEPFTIKYLDENEVILNAIGHNFATDEIQGEWIGLAKFSEAGSTKIRNEITLMQQDGTERNASMISLFSRLLKKHEPIHIIYISGHWLDIDNSDDLADAQKFL
ncbi:MAG: phosphoenolpyruvate mutase [Pseudomonadota bacterium]|nr:phosphoenolpyruvate mutase [Pseudomonadota bacterium]